MGLWQMSVELPQDPYKAPHQLVLRGVQLTGPFQENKWFFCEVLVGFKSPLS